MKHGGAQRGRGLSPWSLSLSKVEGWASAFSSKLPPSAAATAHGPGFESQGHEHSRVGIWCMWSSWAPRKRKWGWWAPSHFMTHTDTCRVLFLWGLGVLGIFILERPFCLSHPSFCIFMLVLKENRVQSRYTRCYKACLTGIHSKSIKFSILSRKFPLKKSMFHLSAKN